MRTDPLFILLTRNNNTKIKANQNEYDLNHKNKNNDLTVELFRIPG